MRGSAGLILEARRPLGRARNSNAGWGDAPPDCFWTLGYPFVD
jgi:hypothetical protein